MKWLFTIFSLSIGSIYGSEWQDTFRFKEVTKLHVSPTHFNELDSISMLKVERYQLKSIDQLLDQENGFFFKRYGNGMLSSVSYRGTNAAQTEVLWNGVVINSPLTGQLDMSLASMISDKQKLAVNTGLTIGAQVAMDPTFLDRNGVNGSISYQYNSLQTHTTLLNLYATQKWFSSNTHFFTLRTKNNYDFPNPQENNARLKVRNAAFEQFSLQQQFAFRITPAHLINAAFWWVKSDRQLPNFSSQTNNLQHQEDDSYRGVLDYSGHQRSFQWKATTSLLIDKLSYTHPVLAIHSHFKSTVSRNSIAVKKDWKKINLSTKLTGNLDYERAVSSGYADIANRMIYKLSEQFLFKPKQWTFDLNIQQVLFKQKFIPAAQLQVNYERQIKQHVIVAGISTARTYRIPSLNDLYWAGAGNPNLKPETGWKYDAKIAYKQDWLTLKATAYGQHIQDWILWQPNVNTTIWQPSNLKKVFGYGVELNTQVGLFQGRKSYAFWMEAAYSFSRIKNMEAIGMYDATVGKQLIYAPLHKANLSLHGYWKGFAASLTYQYIGKVFTSTDNSQFLDPYSLFHLSMSKTFHFNAHQALIGFGVNNLLNQTYFSIPQNPLPGRFYEFTIKLNLKG